MEFTRSRPTTAAADDVENGRFCRLPDPPPPSMPQGGANASSIDIALARRKEELLSELHKGHIRQGMLWRELIETERVMGCTSTGQNSAQTLPEDYWHCRPFSMPPWEEASLLPPCAACRCRSTTGVRAPPLYPHVERSSSPLPLLQPCPSSDTEKQQDCRSSEQRMHPMSGFVELCNTPSKPTLAKEISGHQRADVGEKADVKDGHVMQPLHEIRIPGSGKWKGIDSHIEDRINWISEPMQQWFEQADQENAAYNEKKRTEFTEPPEGTSSGVKRKLTPTSSPVKKQKPLGGDLCQANPVSERRVEKHLVGKQHQSNVAALQTSRTRSNTPEPIPKTTPVWSRITATNTTSFHQDGKENAAQNRWRCNLCQANCNSESNYYDHLGGRRHRENAEAVSSELKSSSPGKHDDTKKRVDLKSALYCMACDVQCSSVKTLVSHLGGRKHRTTLGGSDSD